MGKFNLSKTENEVMHFFWNRNDKFTFGEVYDYFIDEKGKTWKKQTLQTYLSRLVKKGVLANEKKGNTYLYFAKVDEKEYIQNWTKNFLNNTFNGSVKSFLSALSGDCNLDEKTINELKEFLMDSDNLQ